MRLNGEARELVSLAAWTRLAHDDLVHMNAAASRACVEAAKRLGGGTADVERLIEERVAELRRRGGEEKGS